MPSPAGDERPRFLSTSSTSLRKGAVAWALLALFASCGGASTPAVSGPAPDASTADARAHEPDGARNADASDVSAPHDASTTSDVRSEKDAGVDLGRALDATTPDATAPDAATLDTRREQDAGRLDAAGTDDAKATPDAGSPTKDAAGNAEAGTTVDPCAGGTTYADSTKAKTNILDNGWVELLAPTSNQIVEFTTTMVVPPKPASSGTLFLWPGLQPLRGAANFSALDNGVLQPVLTFGPTCAPNSPSMSYKSWWISGQYVNTNIATSSPNYAAYHDCHGGPGMNVAPGDTLDMRFALEGKNWLQTVTNRSNGQSVSYTIDMLGQAQGIAEFVIEEYSSKPLGDVIFTNSVITFASPAKASCQPYQRGANDYFTAPRASADGLRCCIDKVTLRSAGVAATTPNEP